MTSVKSWRDSMTTFDPKCRSGFPITTSCINVASTFSMLPEVWSTSVIVGCGDVSGKPVAFE
jgi:hypothetical protein